MTDVITIQQPCQDCGKIGDCDWACSVEKAKKLVAVLLHLTDFRFVAFVLTGRCLRMSMEIILIISSRCMPSVWSRSVSSMMSRHTLLYINMGVSSMSRLQRGS